MSNHISGKTAKCYICNEKFSSRELAREHLKQEHLDLDLEQKDCEESNNFSHDFL